MSPRRRPAALASLLLMLCVLVRCRIGAEAPDLVLQHPRSDENARLSLKILGCLCRSAQVNGLDVWRRNLAASPALPSPSLTRSLFRCRSQPRGTIPAAGLGVVLTGGQRNLGGEAALLGGGRWSGSGPGVVSLLPGAESPASPNELGVSSHVRGAKIQVV